MYKIIIAAALAVSIISSSACEGEQGARMAIAQYFPGEQGKATRVAMCESTLNPSAVSPGGGNWGLFQINRVHEPLVRSMGFKWSEMTNPYTNAKVARRLRDEPRGWSAWSCGHR